MQFVVCLLCALPLLAVRHSDAPVVEIFVPAVAPPMAVTFYHAQSIAAEIYSRIGVRLRWRRASMPKPGRSKGLAHCTILMDFSWNTPSNLHPGAMAVSNPYLVGNTCVTVFMDRLKLVGEQNPTASAFLLGHILAHEIGHVLQGIRRHSDGGVLKEHWSVADIRRMQVEPLRFTDHDAALILEGIRSRAALQ